MKSQFNISAIITIICGILAVVFAGLTLLGKVTVDLAIVIVGVTQVISGLVQMKMSKEALSEEVSRETYGTAKFSFILGLIFLGVMVIKLIFVAVH